MSDFQVMSGMMRWPKYFVIITIDGKDVIVPVSKKMTKAQREFCETLAELPGILEHRDYLAKYHADNP